MLRNYFITALRNILKNKVFSLINIFGLSVGLAACLLILHYVRYEKSYEGFHQKAGQLYRVTLDSYHDGKLVVQDAETPPVLGPLLKEKYPEVLDFVRMHDEEVVWVKADNKVYKETRLYFADPSIFDLFSIEILHGNPAPVFDVPWKVALNRNLAELYFGTTEATGKTIRLSGGDEPVEAEIVGVFEDLPPNTHLKLNMLVSFSTLKKIGYDPGWDANNEFTYLLMQEGVDLTSFNEKLNEFSFAVGDQTGTERYVAEPMRDIHLYSNKTYEPETNGDARSVYFLMVVAFFIVIIAWVNYLNLSVTRAMERAREVGVRKVAGSSRLDLIWQFLIESSIINFIAMACALIMVQLSLPGFISLSGQPLPKTIFMPSTIGIIAALLLGGIILSGLYPALVLSSFEPVAVLKGKLRHAPHGFWLRKGLVIFQFVITVVLIAGTFAVVQQLNYMRSQDLGINIDEVLVVEAPFTTDLDSVHLQQLSALRNQWKQLSGVQNVSSAGSIPGLPHKYLSSIRGLHIIGENAEDNEYTYYHFGVDASFIPTLGLEIIEGRNFADREKNEDQVILNEESVRLLGLQSAGDAVGKKIQINGEERTIIGVIRDYHHHSLKLSVDPFIYWYQKDNYFMCLDLNTPNLQAAMDDINREFEKLFPDNTMSYFFLDDKFNQQYAADIQFGKVFGIFASLAIIIACLGLFGLSSFTALQRTKEIGVRKAMGASVTNILVLLSADYLKLLVISILVAIPLANYLITEWLNNFAARINVQWWLFFVPCLLVTVVAILSVSSQSIKAATVDPVKSLKYE